MECSFLRGLGRVVPCAKDECLLAQGLQLAEACAAERCWSWVEVDIIEPYRKLQWGYFDFADSMHLNISPENCWASASTKIWGIVSDPTNDTSVEPSETELYTEKALFASRLRVFMTPFYVIVSVVLVVFSVACSPSVAEVCPPILVTSQALNIEHLIQSKTCQDLSFLRRKFIFRENSSCVELTESFQLLDGVCWFFS